MEEDQVADNNSSGGDEYYFDANAQPQMTSGQLGADGNISGQSSDDVFLKLAQDSPESAHSNNPDGHLERKPVSLNTPAIPPRSSLTNGSHAAGEDTPTPSRRC
jgi:hypothetical protein